MRGSCGCRSCGSSSSGSPGNPVPPSEVERDLTRLEAELKRLEAEYNMFFSGPAAEAAVGDAQPRRGAGQAVRSRSHPEHRRPVPLHHAAVALRGVHRSVGPRPARPRRGPPGTVRPPQGGSEGAAEERPRGPHPARGRVQGSGAGDREAARSSTSRWPKRAAKSARRHVPFHKFAELVKGQVSKLRQGGSPEVAFRVAVKDGKVSFTARALKGAKE